MKEYKRLTERKGEEVRELAWQGEILHRLAELEDKIEQGQLVDIAVVDVLRKEISELKKRCAKLHNENIELENDLLQLTRRNNNV